MLFSAFLTGLSISSAAAQPATTSRETLARFIDGNKPTRLFQWFGFDNNCELVRGFNVRIEVLPKNGTVSLERQQGVISEQLFAHRTAPADLARVRKCSGKSVPIIAIVYTPNRGFSGFDQLSAVRLTASRRSESRIDFSIAVR